MEPIDLLNRAVAEYNGPEVTSEKEAYYLARDLLVTFLDYPRSIGSFDRLELEYLARNPPIVSYEQYLELRSMTREELLDTYPELLAFIEEPTAEDIWYYVTRGYVPNYPDLHVQMHRWVVYQRLTKPTQHLLNLLYGDEFAFAAASESLNSKELEMLILAFDDTIGEEELMLKVAERYGFSLSFNEPIEDVFFNQLEQFILQHQGTRELEISKLMNMTEADYALYLKSKSETITRMYDERHYYWPSYANRLVNIE